MKRRTIVYFFILGSIISLFAQPALKVEKVEALTQIDQGAYFYPQLTPDGTKVIFSGPKFTGLFMMELAQGTIETLNTDIGAGYEFQIASDARFVVYRPFTFKNGRRFYSLKKQNLIDKSVSIIANEIRNMSPPRLVNSKIVFLRNEQPVAVNLTPQAQTVSNRPTRTVFIQNRTIIVVEDGMKKELKPLGEGIYLWPRLSPDGNKILFTFAGDGTYISDLDGQILTRIGYANAPVWSPDGQWVAYMVDHDDGHFYTDSEIFISSVDAKQKIQITNTPDIIEMYPNWGSKDIQKLVFSTINGQIFLATLKAE